MEWNSESSALDLILTKRALMTMASIFRTSLRGQHRPRSFPSRSQTRLSSSSSLQQAQQTAQNAFGTASKHAGNAFEKLRKAAGPFGDRAANLLGCQFPSSRFPQFALNSAHSVSRTSDIQPFRRSRITEASIYC